MLKRREATPLLWRKYEWVFIREPAALKEAGMNLNKLTQLKSGRSLVNAIAIAVFALFMFRRITGEE